MSWSFPGLLPPLPSGEEKSGPGRGAAQGRSPALEGRHPDIRREGVWPVIDHLQMEAVSGALGVTEDQPRRKTQKYHIACMEYAPNSSPVQRVGLNHTTTRFPQPRQACIMIKGPLVQGFPTGPPLRGYLEILRLSWCLGGC